MPDEKLPTDKHVTDTPAPRPEQLERPDSYGPVVNDRSRVGRTSPISDAIQATRERIARGEAMSEPVLEPLADEGDEGALPTPGPDQLEPIGAKRDRLKREGEEGIPEAEPAPPEPVYNASIGRWMDPATGNLVKTPANAAELLEAQEAAAAAGEAPAELEAPTTGEEPEEGAEPAAEGEEATFQVVELPPRREGEEPFELEVSDPEAVERIKQLTNGYMRGRDYFEKVDEVETIKADFEEVGRAMATDPAGWMLANIPAETRTEVAIRLLTDDDVYQATVAEVNAWVKNPGTREARRALLEANAAKRLAEFERHQVGREAHQAAAKAVRKEVYALIPENASAEDSEFFRKNALEALKAHVRGTGDIVRPSEVRGLLGEVYRRAFGAPLQSPNGTNGHAARPRAKVPADERRPPKDAAAPAGERFPRRVETRRRAAMVAPAGAGGGHAAEALGSKPGETLQQALERARGLAATGHIKFGSR